MKTDLLTYKVDRRMKEGRKLVSRETFPNDMISAVIMERLADPQADRQHLVTVDWVERTNLMSNLPFWEPKDTPVYMSPAFESYWQM